MIAFIALVVSAAFVAPITAIPPEYEENITVYHVFPSTCKYISPLCLLFYPGGFVLCVRCVLCVYAVCVLCVCSVYVCSVYVCSVCVLCVCALCVCLSLSICVCLAAFFFLFFLLRCRSRSGWTINFITSQTQNPLLSPRFYSF